MAAILGPRDGTTDSAYRIPPSSGTSDITPYPTFQITRQIQHTRFSVPDDTSYGTSDNIPDNTQIQHAGSTRFYQIRHTDPARWIHRQIQRSISMSIQHTSNTPADPAYQIRHVRSNTPDHTRYTSANNQMTRLIQHTGSNVPDYTSDPARHIYTSDPTVRSSTPDHDPGSHRQTAHRIQRSRLHVRYSIPDSAFQMTRHMARLITYQITHRSSTLDLPDSTRYVTQIQHAGSTVRFNVPYPCQSSTPVTHRQIQRIRSGTSDLTHRITPDTRQLTHQMTRLIQHTGSTVSYLAHQIQHTRYTSASTSVLRSR